MMFSNLISLVKLLFIKDKELYLFIRRISGCWPSDIELYKLAFVHRSKPVKLADGRFANNERLEFLGDAVLDLVVADYLYNIYPDKHEGFLTSTRAKIVQRESLNRIGKILHVDTHVSASPHSSSHNSYISGNAVEAMVGAMYLDLGYSKTRKFIINRLITKHFDINDLAKTEQNFKSRLIEWTQKYRVAIEYELVDTFNDADSNPVFRTAVMLGGIYAGDAAGYSKKESHQGASKIVLERLKNDAKFREQVLSTAQ